VGFREVSVVEVREVLRGWLGGVGLRKVAERAGVDRKTARRYVAAAEAAGLQREAGVEALCDELIGAVLAVVRPARPHGHGAAWELLLGRQEQVTAWVAGGWRSAAVVGGEDRRAAHPAGLCGALPRLAPVHGRAVRVGGQDPHDADQRRRARGGVPDRLWCATRRCCFGWR